MSQSTNPVDVSINDPVNVIPPEDAESLRVADGMLKMPDQQIAQPSIAEPNTFFDEPPPYDFKEIGAIDRKELIEDARSISSAMTDATAVASGPFNISRTLLVNAKGVSLVRLPLPARQLEIPVTTPAGDIAYVSTRAKKWSGNATLNDATGKPLLTLEYQFGPGREPKLQLAGGGDDPSTLIKTKGKWTSRRQDFILSLGGEFTWRYIKERDDVVTPSGDAKKRTRLILEMKETAVSDNEKSKAKIGSRRVAELIRDDYVRTPGTATYYAGNGGELRIDSEYAQSMGLREDIIVATCLMMLKKEIDRRRAMQFVFIAAVAVP